MSNVLIEKTNLQNIATAIRNKNGSSDTYLVSEMAEAINDIQTYKPEETFTVTPTTSQQTITPSEGHVFSGGTVNAMPAGTQGDISLTKTVSGHTATINANQTDTTGYIAGTTKTNNTTVTASELVGGSITITTNGTHDVTNYASAIVNAAKPEQTKTATPTISQQIITPDDGYALSSVTVEAMPNGTMGAVNAFKSISGNTATITPAISAGTAGYNTHAGKSGIAVTVTASELVSGSLTITTNTTTDVTNYASVVTNIPPYVERVSSVPSTKSSDIIYNTRNGHYYLWED